MSKVDLNIIKNDHIVYSNVSSIIQHGRLRHCNSHTITHIMNIGFMPQDINEY